jgi:ribosomal protein S18 acetylase RimI-like enzyme
MTPLLTDEPLARAGSACEYLDWDSRFFGLRIARVNGNRLDPVRVAQILDWSRQQPPDCLYFLADLDTATIRLAEQQGFRLVDIRATLAARLPNTHSEKWSSADIREAVPEDIPALREIAGTSHRDTRFYQDGGFPRHLCDELYRVWIEKSCRGDADIVLVAEYNSRPAGYIACNLNQKGSGQIGLVGVDQEARSLGLGRRLVQHSLCWFQQHEAREVIVVTQGNNVAAQRLYQQCGFLTSAVQLWYHLWPARHAQVNRSC